MQNFPYCVIAMDIGGTKIASVRLIYANIYATPVLEGHASIPTQAAKGGAHVLDTVVEVVNKHLSELDPTLPCMGVGVGTAGCVDYDAGVISYASGLMPGWTGARIKERVEKDCKVPCAVMGDVHAHALGEARFGAARGLMSALVVAAGTGLGGAYILNGKVVTGAHGAAGHLGHTLTTVCPDFVCSCGREAHVESVASGTGIGALYQGHAACSEEYDPALDGKEVCKRAQMGEHKALETLFQSGYALGLSVGSWVNIFDPHAVIISGSVLRAGDVWEEGLYEGFGAQVMEPLAETPLLYAELGDDAPLLGAGEHLCDLVFKR